MRFVQLPKVDVGVIAQGRRDVDGRFDVPDRPYLQRMTSHEVIQEVAHLLARWGWVQEVVETESGLDLVAAFEQVSGVNLRNTTPDEDVVLDRFLEPAVDEALRVTARVLGPVPGDEPLPDERWAWIHTITCFNDAPTTTQHGVRQVLATAGEQLQLR